MLARTLESLTKLEKPEGCDVQFLLIDNAPEEPSEDVYLRFKDQFPFPSFYRQEPKKGLVNMRNRMLAEAIDLGTFYLANLDDDETISSDWLVRHYAVLKEYNADVVSGRTERILPPETEDWLIEGGFFEKDSRPTGSLRPTSSTCNVFFNLNKLCIEWGLRFDERLNYISSEDIFFFRQAYERGAKVVWNNESPVVETLTASRVNKQWVLDRAYATGTGTAYRSIALFPAWKAYGRILGFYIGEHITALGYLLRSNKGKSPKINRTHYERHLQLAKGLLNGISKMSDADVYRTHHGV